MILDEIHAVVGNKRGVHLITGVDRLVPLSGEFQRIALSATVKPLDSVAAFIGGSRMPGPGTAQLSYQPRPVTILESAADKRYDIQVRFPSAAADTRTTASPSGSPSSTSSRTSSSATPRPSCSPTAGAYAKS